MGLYTSFDTSSYYDEPNKKAEQAKQKTEITNKPKPQETRTSLYAQAQKIKEYKEKISVDFRKIYRVGQKVAIQGPNGVFRTKKGVIAEIVAENLMYVYMEDTYKDSTDQWLADFVTDEDTIHTL